MDAPQILPRVPKYVRFRVLIIGKANAGKTTILQRVCDTTESPEIHRINPSGARYPGRVQLDPSEERGEHNIEDEFVFTNHKGYVFHDSRGFEAGDDSELKLVQEFVSRTSRSRRLNDRLHAIWYCVPMDNARPSLDLKHFNDICPDRNVPVIAVFTKCDQFRRDIRIKMEDEDRDLALLDVEVEKNFKDNYLAHLGESPWFVRLENMHKLTQRCTDLIEMTTNALSGNAVALILLAVQKNNLELNIKQAVKWIQNKLTEGLVGTENVIKLCIAAFPALWFYVSLS